MERSAEKLSSRVATPWRRPRVDDGSEAFRVTRGQDRLAASARRHRRGRAAVTACMAALAVVSLAACGSSSSSSSSPSSSPSGSSSSSSASGNGANIAAAQAAIAPYIGHPSAFPVDTPLPKPVAAGTKFVYLQCGAPTCALVGKLLAPAIKTIGGTMITVNAGTTAATSQAAASSALSLKPKVVLITGIQPSLFGGRLKSLEAAGAKIVSFSITLPDPQQYGITFNYIGLAPLQRAGRLMADWVVANKGAKANVAFYGAPEITFTPSFEQAFEQELHQHCSSCKVRFVSVSLTTAGTTSQQTIANDLQSHPDTNIAVIGAGDLANGLPPALKAAGISVTTLVYTPTPEQLEAIKDGGLTAGLGVDLPTQLWAGVDAGARLLLGAPLTAGQQSGFGPVQFLGQKDITFNPANGWTGYPNFAQMFAKLWHTTS